MWIFNMLLDVEVGYRVIFPPMPYEDFSCTCTQYTGDKVFTSRRLMCLPIIHAVSSISRCTMYNGSIPKRLRRRRTLIAASPVHAVLELPHTAFKMVEPCGPDPAAERNSHSWPHRLTYQAVGYSVWRHLTLPSQYS